MKQLCIHFVELKFSLNGQVRCDKAKPSHAIGILPVDPVPIWAAGTAPPAAFHFLEDRDFFIPLTFFNDFSIQAWLAANISRSIQKDDIMLRRWISVIFEGYRQRCRHLSIISFEDIVRFFCINIYTISKGTADCQRQNQHGYDQYFRQFMHLPF